MYNDGNRVAGIIPSGNNNTIGVGYDFENYEVFLQALGATLISLIFIQLLDSTKPVFL